MSRLHLQLSSLVPLRLSPLRSGGSALQKNQARNVLCNEGATQSNRFENDFPEKIIFLAIEVYVGA